MASISYPNDAMSTTPDGDGQASPLIGSRSRFPGMLKRYPRTSGDVGCSTSAPKGSSEWRASQAILLAAAIIARPRSFAIGTSVVRPRTRTPRATPATEATAITLSPLALAPTGTLDLVAVGISAFALVVLLGWKAKVSVVGAVLGGGALGLVRVLFLR